MKKILSLLIPIFALATTCTAQVGALSIVNNNTNCSVEIALYAGAPLEIDPACDIIAQPISLAACSGTCTPTTWYDYYAFQTSPGWHHISNALLTGVTDFQWSDAQFKFTCPSYGTKGGSVGVAGSTCVVPMESLTWSATVGGIPVSASASWSGSALTLTFN